MSQIEYPELMTPAEVGRTFHVDAKTVTRWAKRGRLTAVKTIGGHRRYVAFEVQSKLTGRPLTKEQTAMLRHLAGQS